MKKNMSPRVYSQFDKRGDNESTSYGYAYDYGSIMHYGKDYFSDNGKDTLRVGIMRTFQFLTFHRHHSALLRIISMP